MAEDLFLGIDIGTSACKIVAFNAEGSPAFQSAQSYGVLRPQAGQAEQDAEQWWDAVCRGLNEIWEAGCDPARIAAIGVDGQSWAAVPVSAEGRVLANTPLWMDTRAQVVCDLWTQRLGADAIFAVSGNPFSPTYTLPKVLFWMQEEAELIAKTDKILQCNSFVVYRLTGAITQDISQSYGWQNYSQSKAAYDEALTSAFGLPERFLLAPQPCDSIAGHVTPEAAKLCGLRAGTPVVAGGLDAACATLGVGVIDVGQTQEQGGQAGGMSICLNKPIADPKLILGAHVVPGRWLLQGGTVGGGASLAWFSREFGALGKKGAILRGESDAFALLSAEAESAPPGSQGLLFLPYMNGERSPIWDAGAQGAYFGVSFEKTRADFVRATMEGAAFALKHNIDTAVAAGAVISELRASGGSANSTIWTQIKADITGVPMIIPGSDMATTCGAAMLAMAACGVYPDYRAAVDAIVKIRRLQKPEATCQAVYAALYDVYRGFYENNRAAMHALAALRA